MKIHILMKVESAKQDSTTNRPVPPDENNPSDESLSLFVVLIGSSIILIRSGIAL